MQLHMSILMVSIEEDVLTASEVLKVPFEVSLEVLVLKFVVELLCSSFRA